MTVIRFFAIVFFLGIALFKPITHYATIENVNGVVITEKERVQNGENSRYLVWTENEVFENTDSLLALKFRSSDLHGKLRIGATCDLTVNGWRIPLLSSNRNILSATCA